MAGFRLNTLLRVRELARDQFRQQLAEAQRIEQEAADRVAELDETLAELRDAAAPDAGPLDIAQLREVNRFVATVKARREAAREQHRILAEEAETRRQEVVEADKQVKVLEKLREKHELAHRVAQVKLADKQIDDLVSRLGAWRS